MRMLAVVLIMLLLISQSTFIKQDLALLNKKENSNIYKKDLLWKKGGNVEVLLNLSEGIKTLPCQAKEFNSTVTNGNESSFDNNDTEFFEIKSDPEDDVFGVIIYYQQNEECTLHINATVVMISGTRIEYIGVNVSAYMPKIEDFVNLGPANNTQYLMTTDYLNENGTVIIKISAPNYGGTFVDTYIRIYYSFLKTGYLHRIIDTEYYAFDNKTIIHRINIEIPEDNTLAYFLNLSRYLRFKALEPNTGEYISDKNAILFHKAGKYSIYFESFDFWNYPYPLSSYLILKDRDGNILQTELFEIYYQKFMPISSIINGYLFKRAISISNDVDVLSIYVALPIDLLGNKISIFEPDIQLIDEVFGLENYTIIELNSRKFLMFRYLLPSLRRNITLRYYNYFSGEGFVREKPPLITLADLFKLNEYGIYVKSDNVKLYEDQRIICFEGGSRGYLNITKPIEKLSTLDFTFRYPIKPSNISILIKSLNGAIVSIKLVNQNNLQALFIEEQATGKKDYSTFGSLDDILKLRVLIDYGNGTIKVYLNDTTNFLCMVNITDCNIPSLSNVSILFEGDNVHITNFRFFSENFTINDTIISDEIREAILDSKCMFKTDFYQVKNNVLDIDTSCLIRVVIFDQFNIKIFDKLLEPSNHIEIQLPVNKLKLKIKRSSLVEILPLSFGKKEEENVIYTSNMDSNVFYLTKGLYKIKLRDYNNKTNLEFIMNLERDIEINQSDDLFEMIDEFMNNDQLVLMKGIINIPYPQTNISKNLGIIIIKTKDLINSVNTISEYMNSLNVSNLYYSLREYMLSILNVSNISKINKIIIDFTVGNITTVFENDSLLSFRIDPLEFELDILNILNSIIEPTHLTSLSYVIEESIIILNTTFGKISLTGEFLNFSNIESLTPILLVYLLHGLAIYLPFIDNLESLSVLLFSDNFTIKIDNAILIYSDGILKCVTDDIIIKVNVTDVTLSTAYSNIRVEQLDSMILKVYDFEFSTYKFVIATGGSDVRIKLFTSLKLFEFKLINKYTMKELPLKAISLYVNNIRLNGLKLVTLLNEIIIEIRDSWSRTIFVKQSKNQMNIISLKFGRIKILNKIDRNFFVKIYPLNSPQSILKLDLPAISNIEIFAPGEESYNVSIFFTNGSIYLSRIVTVKSENGQEPIITIILKEETAQINLLLYIGIIAALIITFVSYVFYQKITFKKRVLIEARELLKAFLNREIEIEEEEQKLLSREAFS